MSKEEQINFVKFMEGSERTVEKLYRLFTERNPEQAEFWTDLADKEKGHAKLLEEFCGKIEKDEASVRRKFIDQEELKNSIKKCEEILERTKSSVINYSVFIEQLNEAVELERRLVKKEFFEVLKTDDRLLKKVLKKLKKDTIKHRKRLEKARRTEKRK